MASRIRARTFLLLAVVGGSLISATAAMAASTDRPASADLILTHAHVYTPGRKADAVAIGGGRILAVGSASEMQEFRSRSTTVVSLQGRTIFPGLIDMHVHPLNAASLLLDSCHLDPGPAAGVVRAVAACVMLREPGEWIMGGQFVMQALGAIPTRQMLDAVAPNNPVLLVDDTGHNIWVNSRALKLAGVSRSTPDRPGGAIERDASGEPTGVLRDGAELLFLGVMPKPSRDMNLRDLEWATQLLLSLGVTSFTDASVVRYQLQAYDDLADAGKLKQHVRICLLWEPDFDQGKMSEAVNPITEGPTFARPNISPSCVKIFLDGVPTEARTAAFIDPYEPAPGRPKDERGALQVPPDLLKATVIRFDKAGLTVKFHASGDAADREGLDAVEAARQANGPGGPRHEIAHAGFIQASDIVRAKQLGATLEFSPALWGIDRNSPMAAGFIGIVGLPRMDRLTPVREALDAGVTTVAGTDWPSAPTPNIWYAIEALVTRLPAGASTGEPFAAQERIALREAVDLYTINAARQLGTDKDEGSIEPGKRADLIVLDKDPFDIPIDKVHAVKVMATFINGELVYGSPAPQRGKARK
jgi:predicted amidohydrolase YtcJ